MTTPISCQLIFEGDRLYADMIEAIQQAKQSIKLESYIYQWDQVGKSIAHALKQAAKRGVDVKLHLDDFGCEQVYRDELLTYFAKPIKLKLFGQWRWGAPLRYLYRNHRKLLIIDNKLLFIGGFNISNVNSKRYRGEKRWFDCHAKITGEPAHWASYCFQRLWKRRWPKRIPKFHRGNWCILPNQTVRNRFILRRVLIQHIRNAQKSIVLMTPYLVPGKRLSNALIRAVNRGVSVKVVVPAINDHPAVQALSEVYLRKLQKAGVEVYAYLPRMLHAKTMLIDDTWCSIGTANLDYRSFRLNYEINLFSKDASCINQLHSIQARVIAESEIWSRNIHRLSWWHRFLGQLAWPFRRLF